MTGTGSGGTGSGSTSGESKALPWAMAAAQALSSAGSIADSLSGLKSREFKLNKQAQNQRAYMGYLDAINAQKRRVGETPGKQYLLGQMMQRLGLDPSQLSVAKELQVRPVSGNFDPAKTFADQYGGQYAKQYYDDNKRFEIQKAMKRAGKNPYDYYNMPGAVPGNAMSAALQRSMTGGR